MTTCQMIVTPVGSADPFYLWVELWTIDQLIGVASSMCFCHCYFQKYLERIYEAEDISARASVRGQDDG